jgi:carbon-monoxide dehydrogenase small subunit
MSLENQSYTISVNNKSHEVQDAWIGESLLYVLRERLGMPGAKGACEQGECGSCTVLLDGEAVCSCLVLAAATTEADIRTVESIGDGQTLSEVQQAFIESGAVQCGFCTPGLIVAVENLLTHNPQPTEMQVKEALSGNICRCTGYGRIFDAVSVAVARRTGASQ